MIVRFFLLIIMLFHFSALTEGEEKLVIIPSRDSDIPESVKSAIQAIGQIDRTPGFFIDEGVFVASSSRRLFLSEKLLNAKTPENGPFSIVHLRKATQQELAENGGSPDRTTVYASFGEGTLAKGKENMAVFKVSHEDESKLFTTKPEKFLKVSEFQEGDKVFLITTYYYDHYENPDNASSSYKKGMIMEVSNPDIIKNKTIYIDLGKSSLLNDLKWQVNRSLAVNQKGEVIGFIRTEMGQLIKLTSDTIAFLSRTTKESLEQEALKLEEERIRITNEQALKKEAATQPISLTRRRSFIQRCATAIKNINKKQKIEEL